MTAVGRYLRARAALYALLMAVCQLGLSVSASAVMLTAAHAGITSVAEADCSCEHSAAGMCPMHRRNAPRPVPTGTPRWCGAGDDSIFALVPVYGALTVPEPVQRAFAPSTTSPSFPRSTDRPVRLDRPPDSPPPRA